MIGYLVSGISFLKVVPTAFDKIVSIYNNGTEILFPDFDNQVTQKVEVVQSWAEANGSGTTLG